MGTIQVLFVMFFVYMTREISKEEYTKECSKDYSHEEIEEIGLVRLKGCQVN